VVDAWIRSLDQLLGAELIQEDPEYDVVSNLRARKLPYKS